MAVATYCYYEKVRRTMRIAIVSYLLKTLGLSFSSKLDWGSYISSITELAPGKLKPFILRSFHGVLQG